MQYFDTLPKIIQFDNEGIGRIFTNLLARASVIPELLKSPVIYYNYDIQDGDTPEIIAHKYYGDPYRYWILLLANEILDPQWEWPMSGKVFGDYISAKYGVNQSSIHHYEKIVTQFDSGTNTTTTNTIIIDEDTYTTTLETTKTFLVPTGEVTVAITKSPVTNYDYESNENEKKRSIKILNSNYVNQFETELKNLMSV